MTLLGDGVADGVSKVFEVVGTEVRQVRVLRVIPALLRGIQFGAIGRQEFEGEPVGVMLLEIGRHRAMHIPAVPNDDRVMTIMSMQQPQ